MTQYETWRETVRNATFGGANCLDNYIALNDDAVDWLIWIDETGTDVGTADGNMGR
ncbi:MAG: hypothetical protein QOJ64_3636, partial [Acidobacteriota bacterium]|nr:hypothetical protein [Acidobacteriota bacterium]